MTKTETLYRLPTAAAILTVTPRTLKNWHDQGKIRFVELPGGHFRVPGEEITRLLQAITPQAQPATEATP
jgi:excisionase family DNA binding protein